MDIINCRKKRSERDYDQTVTTIKSHNYENEITSRSHQFSWLLSGNMFSCIPSPTFIGDAGSAS